MDDDAIILTVELPFDWKDSESIKKSYIKAKALAQEFVVDEDNRYSISAEKNCVEIKLFVN
ncbi:hypothetical protein D3C87_2113220 [compost metagenome]